MKLLRMIFGGVKEIDSKTYRVNYIEKNTPHLLIDVRNPQEYASGHIDGATNIPFNKLSKKLEALPKDKSIVCVCRTGPRGREATYLLQKAGFEVTNLVGGVMEWRKEGNKLSR